MRLELSATAGGRGGGDVCVSEREKKSLRNGDTESENEFGVVQKYVSLHFS